MGITGTLLYRQLGIMLSTLSTMIAVVLAFLILYANQFLLKRRKKELGVYMMLGMKKGRISRLFAGETLCVGIIALGTGLLLGFFFSQGFSLIALRLFAINLEKFRIVFSAGALRQTVLCFTIIFFIVMLFNIRSVTNVKLIDLLTDGRKNESMQTENRILPVCLFLLSLLCIGISAALFNKNGVLPSHENNLFQLAAAALVAGTFLLFYSLSAVFMQVASARKCFYLKGLNTFLVRQIGSKIRTNYLVVTVVCGLLTITICAVSIGASTALAMNKMSQSATPYDLNVLSNVSVDGDSDIAAYLAAHDITISNYAKATEQISVYEADMTYSELFEGQKVKFWPIDEKVPDSKVSVISISDLNRALAMQNKAPITLNDGQYLLNCNYNGTYTELIKSKPEWSLAGIYADEAITGTQVKKREDFQRLINDCMNGDVDMVITKSISRFARNTLDTLKYVRMLKDKGVAVFFEEENINTLTMDGELLLVILSSVAQQEVENISANVKKGLKMKMQRGELVGFQGCLGYDYNPEDKTLTVNEEEAAVVRYIFQRYTEGAGGSVIAKELENLGYKTKRGSPKWADSTVIGIIKNEKYKGDILLGKTFTVDPISKRRLYNFGEEDQFYIREHHEPIISEEVFEAAQEILRRRAKPRSLNVDGKREKFSRKYAFSCMIECGFCGGTLTRRSWHSSSQYNKAIWQCVVSTKKGKKFCPESKGVDERTIERAFVESYRLLCQNNKDVLDEFMKRTEEALSESNAGKRLAKAEKDIHALEVKKNKLVDMRLEDTIDKETYDRKYLDLSSQIEQLQKECESLQDAAETETTMRKRVAMFRQTLEQNEVLDTFDRHIFESIVEKVIVGGYDSDGNKDPYMIVFVYKTGFKNSVDGKNFKPLRKNSKENHSPAVLCSHASNEAESMCSDSSDDTCGVRTSNDP